QAPPPPAPSRPAEPAAPAAAGPAADGGPRAPEGGRLPPAGAGRMPDLSQRPGAARPQRKRGIPRPQYRGIIATPPPLKKPPVEPKKPQEPVAQKPIARLPTDMVKGGGPVNVTDLMKQRGGVGAPAAGEVAEDEEEGAEGAKGKVRPGGVVGRDKRHA